MEESKLVKYINITYFFMRLNFLMIISLILGLGIFSIGPTVKAAIVIISELNDGTVDEKDNIYYSYVRNFYKEFKCWKDNVVNLALLIWAISIYIISISTNSEAMAIIKYLIYYVVIMVILFILYKVTINVVLEKSEIKRVRNIEVLALMFIKPKELFTTVVLTILFIALALYLPILMIFLLISLFVYGFYKLNIKNIEAGIELIIKRREVAFFEK